MKRVFDIVSAGLVLILLMPFLLVIGLLIVLDSKGGVFFAQVRVGKNEKHFSLLKFRTMRPASESKGQLTIGKDPRITSVGRFLRKYKLDEIPQLINILKGEMSVVGPRPEVPKYVAMYTNEQKKVLSVRPGLTDLASIEYINESEVLAKSSNPEETYINEIMPHKLALNLVYIEKQSLAYDFKLIFKTMKKIID